MVVDYYANKGVTSKEKMMWTKEDRLEVDVLSLIHYEITHGGELSEIST
jgi:hypothetical protein